MSVENQNEAPKEKKIDWNSLLSRLISRITKTESLLSVFGILIALWGIMLTCKSNNLNSEMLKFTKHQDGLTTIQTDISKIQLKISQRQDTTSLDIMHFDSLLIKIDTLLNTENKLRHTLIDETNVLIDLHNMNAEAENRKNQQMLLDKVNSYNDIATAFNELGPVLADFRIGRDNHLVISATDVKKRIHILDTISSKFNMLKPVMYMRPNAMLEMMMDSCYNAFGQYRRAYHYNVAIGGGVYDTSYYGQKLFNEVVYSFLDLEDSIAAHLDENREIGIRNLRQIEKTIDSNSKIPNNKH